MKKQNTYPWAAVLLLAILAMVGCAPAETNVGDDENGKVEVTRKANGAVVYTVSTIQILAISDLSPYRFDDPGYQRCIPENAGAGYNGTAPTAISLAGVDCESEDVTSAELKLFAHNYSGAPGITAHPLLVSWDFDEATWFERSSGQYWDETGARGSGDIGSPIGSGTFSTQSSHAPISIPVTSYVTSALDNPSSNYGLLLRSTDTNSDPGVYVGLTVHISSELDSSEQYRPKLEVTCDGPPNQPPTATIDDPLSNDVFDEHDDVVVSMSCTDSDGTCSKMELHDGATLICTDMTAPYSCTINNITTGNHALQARSYDNGNAQTNSSTVTITVNNVNDPPAITAGPTANPSTAVVNNAVNFSVTASDPDPNTTLSYSWTFVRNSDMATVGTATVATPSFTFTSVGTYTATVVVSDGGLQVQGSVQVTVNEQSSEVTVVFQDGLNGYAGTKCARVSNAGGLGSWNNNDGATVTPCPLHSIGGTSTYYRWLLGFDISSIPSGATIQSAVLTLVVTNNWSSNVLSVYHLKVDYKHQGEIINANNATFGVTHRGTFGGTVQSWPNQGVLGTDTLYDFNGPATANLSNSGSEQTVALQLSSTWVGEWRTNSNRGLLITAGSSPSVHGPASSTQSKRPKLTVVYQ